MIVFNSEWRHNFWKIFDLHLFFDIGRVNQNIFEESDKIIKNLHPAWGIGGRITVPPNVVMRGDFGWSRDDMVFYLNFGHTF